MCPSHLAPVAALRWCSPLYHHSAVLPRAHTLSKVRSGAALPAPGHHHRCSPGYSPSSSQRPRRGRPRRPGAMASRAPAVPAPCRALRPLETRWGRELGRDRARPTAAPTPRAVEGGSWRAAPEVGAQLGPEGSLLECLQGPMDLEGLQVPKPSTSLCLLGSAAMLWSALQTARGPISFSRGVLEWWGQNQPCQRIWSLRNDGQWQQGSLEGQKCQQVVT